MAVVVKVLIGVLSISTLGVGIAAGYLSVVHAWSHSMRSAQWGHALEAWIVVAIIVVLSWGAYGYHMWRRYAKGQQALNLFEEPKPSTSPLELCLNTAPARSQAPSPCRRSPYVCMPRPTFVSTPIGPAELKVTNDVRKILMTRQPFTPFEARIPVPALGGIPEVD